MSRRSKPKLGQNFLADLSARERIVDALGDLSTSTVIEIGPGHGAITELLARRSHRLIAIELDRNLAPALRTRFAAQPNVEIVEADVLTVDLPALLGEGETAAIVGNLPYYITSDILLHLFRTVIRAPGRLSAAVLMTQREVAERVAASPGRRDFGLLSATAQMHARAELVFTLGPESFSPAPEVDSTVIRLDFRPRFAELDVHPAAFDLFLHRAFAQKRKTLGKNLRNAGYSSDAMARAWPGDLDPQARAEATSLEQLAVLHRALRHDRP